MVWYHRILTTLYANLALSSLERSTDPENPCWSHSWQFSRKPSPNKNNSYVVLYGSFWRSGWTKWPMSSAGDPSGSSRGSDLTNLTLSRAKFLMSCWTSKSDGRCGKNMEKSEMMLNIVVKHIFHPVSCLHSIRYCLQCGCTLLGVSISFQLTVSSRSFLKTTLRCLSDGPNFLEARHKKIPIPSQRW